MSEKILKALMQLFAIITKQDGGVTENERKYVKDFLDSQLEQEKIEEYFSLYDSFLKEDSASIKKQNKSSIKEVDYSKLSEEEIKKEKLKAKRRQRKEQLKKLALEREGKTTQRTSVADSVKTLSICKSINKTLSQKQKVVVLSCLFELIKSDHRFTDQRMQIIDTVADVFNFDKKEFNEIQTFIVNDEPNKLDIEDVLVLSDDIDPQFSNAMFTRAELLDGLLVIMKVPSVELYFLRYLGQEELRLNGLILNNKRVYLFAPGSTIRPVKAKPIYYSDIVAKFLRETEVERISFNVRGLGHKFKNGVAGIKGVDISEEQGKLFGIMGSSGAGKTTLLNILSGQLSPSKGEVLVNGVNIYTNKKEIKGVFGYIPQDDLLIEELTVYQNLYYNAKLCLGGATEEEITDRIKQTLNDLGLWNIRDLKVGNPLQKTISGGQRKRLNIALELIRKPSILFVDEPTSGLSSKDSENVMDLLRELSLKGKLIFVVIHQPSSDIYKLFDKIFILDQGGYPIYYGNPLEALIYFKTIDKQINNNQAECLNCGNVNVELVFNIIEANVVDEYGQFTGVRKVTAVKWNEFFNEKIGLKDRIEDEKTKLQGNLSLPNKANQYLVFITRDILSKLANRQYVLINLLEAPLLALILSFIVRFVDTYNGAYAFGLNDNIPAYFFMCIIVALFMGMTVSAEEIVRDQKILKREQFLALSKFSYYSSKVSLLFLISAIQTICFVVIGNNILDIRGLYFEHWFMLFTTSCFANMLGLNISASFNSAVTIYIMIPLLLIPQLVLSGALFSFEKLNKYVGSEDKVPYIADFMTSRWVFEAIAVEQYINNGYEKYFYDLEKAESFYDFRQVYMLPELETKIDQCIEILSLDDKGKKEKFDYNLKLISNVLLKEQKLIKDFGLKCPDFIEDIESSSIGLNELDSLSYYIKGLISYSNNRFSEVNTILSDKKYRVQKGDKQVYRNWRQTHFNEALAKNLRKTYSTHRFVESSAQLIQQIDPVYRDPVPDGILDYRAHFYAPQKHFFGYYFSTYWFNICVVWFFSILLYLSLYLGLFKYSIEKFSSLLSKFNIR